MDENEWLECTDPQAMFTHVRDRIDQRRQRLLACACVRSVWHNLQDERFRAIVEQAEECADGRVTVARLAQATKLLWDDTARVDFSRILIEPSQSAIAAARNVGYRSVSESIDKTIQFSTLSAAPLHSDGVLATSRRQALEPKLAHARHLADLFRDIVGNPFRPVALHSDWLAWEGGTVGRLAETIYQERRYQDLPVLADALEDAGCDDPEVIGHLRGRGVHARGCWVLDLARGV